jgi:anti-anti-sigma regulatory factor
VFLITQKRAKSSGGGIKLINANQQIYDIFTYAGFDRIIDIARGAA